MKRRDFLKWWIDVPIIGFVTGRKSEGVAGNTEETSRGDIEFSKEQLFVSSNPKLRKSFNSKGHCYMIMHPGYANYLYYKDELIRDLLKDVKKYGDYASYLANISKLIEFLNNSDELTVFAIEKRDFYDEKIPKKRLRPSNSAMIIVTEDWSNNPEEYVRMEAQRSDLMFSFLKRSDVKEARFAGEWGWWCGDDGCLSLMADDFYKNGFDVKGIKGCLYPAMPDKYDNRKILKKLYNEQITLDAILSRTLD